MTKMPDIFPPADENALDGRILLACYKPVELLEMSPAEFELAYRFVSDCRIGSLLWTTNLVYLSSKAARRYKTTRRKLFSIFPESWHLPSWGDDRHPIMVPPKLLSRDFAGDVYSQSSQPDYSTIITAHTSMTGGY